MPLSPHESLDVRKQLLATLDEWTARHHACAPRGIPVGGGDWMDSFFRMEALAAAVGSLRKGCSISAAILSGKLAAREAVRKWNKRREYQVRRWDQCCDEFIRNAVMNAMRSLRSKP